MDHEPQPQEEEPKLWWQNPGLRDEAEKDRGLRERLHAVEMSASWLAANANDEDLQEGYGTMEHVLERYCWQNGYAEFLPSDAIPPEDIPGAPE